MNPHCGVTIRGVIATVVFLLLPIVGGGQTGVGQPGATGNMRDMFQHPIDVLAASVKPGDVAAMEHLAEAVVGASLFAGAPSAATKRLATAHSLYQNGSRSAVSLNTLTDAVNALGRTLSLPSFIDFTPDQILNIRLRLLSTFPVILVPLNR